MDDSDATDKGWVRVNFDSVTGIIKLDRYGTYWLHRQEKKRTCNYRINAHNAEWHTV